MEVFKVKNVIKLSSIILLSGAFLCYYYTYNPAEGTTFFASCPSQSIFGVYCPGCGSQRLIHSLLHLNFEAAFRYNPLLFVLFPFVIYLLYIFVSNSFFNTHYRVALLYRNWFVISLFTLLLLYGILRNLQYYPFVLLAPPN